MTSRVDGSGIGKMGPVFSSPKCPFVCLATSGNLAKNLKRRCRNPC